MAGAGCGPGAWPARTLGGLAPWYCLGMSGDAERLAQWRAGDEAAGEALIGAHYDTILRFFRTKAGEDADDLVQRTFLRCLEPRADYQGRASFRAFLFGIARNVLLEYIRACVRDRRVDPDFSVRSIHDLSPRASTAVFAKTEERKLVAALQQLPVELQMALELYYWEELPVDEVAMALQIPPGTVKSRLHRGRQQLRALIEAAPRDADWTKLRSTLDSWQPPVAPATRG